MNNGQKVLVAYFGIFLAMPALASAVLGSRLVSIYWLVPANLYAVASACLVIIGTLALTKHVRQRPSQGRMGLLWRILLPATSFYNRHRLGLSIVALLLSAAYFSAGFLTFRYMSLGISDQDSALLLAGNLLSIWIMIDFTYRIFADSRSTLPLQRRVGDVLLASAFTIATNGTASSLLGLAFLGYALLPGIFHRAVFLTHGHSVFLQSLKTAGVLVLTAALFLAAWVSGEAIKSASAGEKDLLTAVGDVIDETQNDGAANYFYYVISSLSTHYYAHTFTAATARDEIRREASWPLLLPAQTLIFRAGYLLGTESSRPEIGSFARLNYVLLTAEPLTERQGTSPGLLAAFEYALGFPLAPIACIFYAAWSCVLFERLIAPGRRLTPAGAILLLGIVLFMFQSPFDMLSVFDNTTLTLVGIVGIAAFANRPEPLGARASSWQARPGSMFTLRGVSAPTGRRRSWRSA